MKCRISVTLLFSVFLWQACVLSHRNSTVNSSCKRIGKIFAGFKENTVNLSAPNKQ